MKSFNTKTFVRIFFYSLPAILLVFHCTMRDGDVKGRMNPLDPLIEKPDDLSSPKTSYVAVSQKWSNFSFRDTTGSLQCSLMQTYEYITLNYGLDADSLQQINISGKSVFTLDGFEVNRPCIFKFTGYFRNGESNSESFTDTTPAGIPPLPPSGIRGEGTLQGAMLQWDAVATAQEYSIQRTTAEGEKLVLLRESTVCTDILSDYNTHRYRVGSVNQYGVAYSDSILELRKITSISPPDTCFASKGVYPDYVLLNWTPVVEASSYRVYRSAAPEGLFTSIGVITDTVFKDSNVSKGALYYRIASINDSGYTGGAGATVKGWIIDSIGVPGDVTATIGVINDRVMVFWSLVRNAAAYNIYKAVFSEGPYERVATVSGSDNFFTDSLVTRIVNYYKVSAVDSNGVESLKSAYASGTLKSIAIPGNLAASQGTSLSEITVTWDSVPTANSYFLYKSATEKGSYTRACSTAATVFNDVVGMDSSCYYRVSCRIGRIESEFSPAVNGWTMADNAPSNLTASLGSYISHIMLQWREFQGSSKYVIYRAVTATGPYLQIATVDTNTYNDSTITTDNYYYYRVAAVIGDSMKVGKQSDYTMGFVQTFGSPQNVYAIDNHPSKVYVRWDSVAQAQYYIVYRSLSSTGLTPIDTVTNPVYIDTLLPGNVTSAYYQVCAGLKTRIGMRSTTVKGSILLPPSSGTIYNQNDRAMVTWSSVRKAKLYKVYRSYGGQSNFSLIGSTQERFMSDSVFTTSGTYYYRVTSSSDSGESKSGLLLTVNFLPGPAALNGNFSDSTVKLWWPKVSSASYYTIYRSERADSIVSSIATTSDTNFKDISLTRSGNYYYQVRANFSSGSFITTGSPVVKVSVIVKPLAPTVSASTTYQGYIRVSWTPNSSGSTPTSYIVYRSTSSLGLYEPLDTVEVFYFNDSVSLTRNYYYKVSALNSVGEGPRSSYAIGYAASPSAPVAVSASYDIYPKGILFTWKKSSGATSYVVSRASYFSGSKTVLDTVSDTSFFDTTVSAGLAYFYFVRQLTVNGMASSYSTESVSGRGLAFPSSIRITAYINYLHLSWSGSTVSGVYYKIYRAISSGGPFTILDSTVAYSYVDSVTSPDIYYYKISSVNKGESELSSYLSGRLSSPALPVMGSASTGSVGVISVNWRKVSDAKSYKLYRSRSTDFTNSVLVGSVADTFFIDTVPSDSMYYYKCKSVGSFGQESSLSSGYVRGYRSPTSVPPIPESFQVNNNSSSYIYMYWSMPSGTLSGYSYKIYRSENEAGPFAVIDSITSTSYYDYVSKTFPDKYWYYVTSRNAAGESAPSDTLPGSRR
ncbi:MAG: hypothetical protein JW915_07455 [Chitinispirillaceae bacterium]|nr:hypothetical protein [Chitinispirillaceae bacterium]